MCKTVVRSALPFFPSSFFFFFAWHTCHSNIYVCVCVCVCVCLYVCVWVCVCERESEREREREREPIGKANMDNLSNCTWSPVY